MDDKKRHADAARRLINDPLFSGALASIRSRALDELAVTDPTDADAIRRLQSVVFVVGRIASEIESVIYASGEHDGGFSA